MASDPNNRNPEIPVTATETEVLITVTPIPTSEIPVTIPDIPIPVQEKSANPNPEIPVAVPEIPIVPLPNQEVTATETEISITITDIPVAAPNQEITATETKTVTEIPPSEIPGKQEIVPAKKFEAGRSSKSSDKKKVKGGSLMGILRKNVMFTCGSSKQTESDRSSDQSEGDNVSNEGNQGWHSWQGSQNEGDNVSNEGNQGSQNEGDNVSNEEAGEENDPHNSEDDDNAIDIWGIEEGSMHVLRYVNNNMMIGLQEMLNSMNIFPGDYADWNALARATLQFWRMANPDNPIVPELEHATPANCWPGSVTIFGRITVEGQNITFEKLNWTDRDFEDVRANINCLIVIEI